MNRILILLALLATGCPPGPSDINTDKPSAIPRDAGARVVDAASDAAKEAQR